MPKGGGGAIKAYRPLRRRTLQLHQAPQLVSRRRGRRPCRQARQARRGRLGRPLRVGTCRAPSCLAASCLQVSTGRERTPVSGVALNWQDSRSPRNAAQECKQCSAQSDRWLLAGSPGGIIGRAPGGYIIMGAPPGMPGNICERARKRTRKLFQVRRLRQRGINQTTLPPLHPTSMLQSG